MSSLISQIGMVTGGALFRKLAGFLLILCIARLWGATADTDAYLLAFSFIMFFSFSISNILETNLVPALNGAGDSRRTKLIKRCFSVFLKWGGIGTISAFLTFTAARMFFPDMPVFKYLQIFSPLIVLSALGSLAHAILFREKIFHLPFLLDSLSPFTAVAALLFTTGMPGAAAGYVGGQAISVMIQYRFAGRFIGKQDIGHEAFGEDEVLDGIYRTFFSNLGFTAWASVLVSLNPVVDNLFAYQAGAGGVSLLEYALRLFLFPVEIFGGWFSLVLLSRWSDISQRRPDALWNDFTRTCVLLFIITASCSFILSALARPLMSVIYGFDGIDGYRILQAYLLGLPFYIQSNLTSRAFQALQKTKIFIKIGTLNFLLNLAGNFALFPFFGLPGIALSTSATQMICTIVFLRTFRRTLGYNSG